MSKNHEVVEQLVRVFAWYDRDKTSGCHRHIFHSATLEKKLFWKDEKVSSERNYFFRIFFKYMKVICFDLLQKNPSILFFLISWKRNFHFYSWKRTLLWINIITYAIFRIYTTFTDFGNFLYFSKEIYIFSSNIRNFRRIWEFSPFQSHSTEKVLSFGKEKVTNSESSFCRTLAFGNFHLAIKRWQITRFECINSFPSFICKNQGCRLPSTLMKHRQLDQYARMFEL